MSGIARDPQKNGISIAFFTPKGRFVSEKTSLKIAINHLIENCYSNVQNVTMKHVICISMGIDQTPF